MEIRAILQGGGRNSPSARAEIHVPDVVLAQDNRQSGGIFPLSNDLSGDLVDMIDPFI